MIMAYQDSIGPVSRSPLVKTAKQDQKQEARSNLLRKHVFEIAFENALPRWRHAIVMATLCSVHAHCSFRDTRSAHGGALEVKDPVTQEIPRVSLQSWYQ